MLTNQSKLIFIDQTPVFLRCFPTSNVAVELAMGLQIYLNQDIGKYKILIITGDNILTAAKVGLTVKLGESVMMLEKEGSKNMLEFQDGSKH